MPLKKKLIEYLDQNNIRYLTMIHSRAYTAQELAAALHVPGDSFAKAVILRADDKHVMAVLPATYKVDLEKFKSVVNASMVELASENDFINLFPGCELGAMPPFGNLYELPTFVDVSLTEKEDIYFNATTHSEVVKMKFSDYQRLVNPIVTSFARHV